MRHILAIALLTGVLAWCDLVLFPGKRPIRQMTGFQTWKIEDDVIHAVQSKDYSYTAAIPVHDSAEKYRFLHLLLRSPNAVSARLVIYFRSPGEKNFSTKSLRAAVSLSPNKLALATIPLNGKEWKGEIDSLRLDFSSEQGQEWFVERIWLAPQQAMTFLDTPWQRDVELEGTAACPAVIRYDLENGREYCLTAQVQDNGGGVYRLGARFLTDDDESTGDACPGVTQSGSGELELRCQIPEAASQTVFNLERQGGGKGTVSSFRIRPVEGVQRGWTANWLCHPKGRRTSDTAYFAYRKTFQLPWEPLEARMQLTADDGFALYLNGQSLGVQTGGWQAATVLEMTGKLQAGENTLECRVVNSSGPTGLIAHLRCYGPSGEQMDIVTDASWQVVRLSGSVDYPFDYTGAVAAQELGVPPIAPWHRVRYVEFSRRQVVTVRDCSLAVEKLVLQGKLELDMPFTGTLRCQVVVNGVKIAPIDLTFKNGKAQLPLDLANLHLQGGDYDLVWDNATITPPRKLASFAVANAAHEPNHRVVMTSREGCAIPTLDGEPFWFGFYKGGFDSARLKAAYHQAGYRIFILGFTQGTADGSNQGHIWKAMGVYDYSKLEKRLTAFFKICPEARVILTYGIDAPPWWTKAHPGDCVLFEGRDKPEGLQSHGSLAWRKDSLAAFQDFLRHLEQSQFAPRILGYRIQSHCSGGEFQYLGGWQRKHADYSPAMQAYFRQFLRQRYGTDAALQAAWHNPEATLDTATIPTGAERAAADFLVFRDLDARRNVVDFQECLAHSIVDSAQEFLKCVRAYAPGKLAGLYGGYVFYYSDFQLLNCAHAGFRELYQSGLADFICSPNDYIQRKVGWPAGHHGPSVGTALYNLAYLDENDTRTFLCATASHRHVANLHETIGVLKRDFALQLTKGLGNGFYDLGGGWFSNAGILEAMRRMNRIGQFAVRQPGFRRARVAVLYSAESISRLAEKNGSITIPVREHMRHCLGCCGVPADQYLLEDILQDNFPEYDCYILPNAYVPSNAVRKCIDAKLKRAGKTLVFGYAPGAFVEGQGTVSTQAMRDLTGISFGWENRREKRRVATALGEYGSGSEFGPFFYIDDPGVETLGTYRDSGKVAIARAAQPGGWTSLVTLVPEMTTPLWRHLLRQQGLHVFSDSDDPVYYDGRFVAIHAASSGVKKLRLPEARNWYDLFRGKPVATNAREWEGYLHRGKTELFFLGSPRDFERFMER